MPIDIAAIAASKGSVNADDKPIMELNEDSKDMPNENPRKSYFVKKNMFSDNVINFMKSQDLSNTASIQRKETNEPPSPSFRKKKFATRLGSINVS